MSVVSRRASGRRRERCLIALNHFSPGGSAKPTVLAAVRSFEGVPPKQSRTAATKFALLLYPTRRATDAGTITLDDQDVWRLSARDTARRVGVVLQERVGTFDFSVREIVLMGRSPHKRPFDRETADDLRIVDQALAQVGLTGFADRSFPTLSGGEQQRALVARALVQQAQVLVLDEPTSHLDVYHQFQVLDLVRALQVTTIAALHDLNLAALYCDYLYVLKAGALVASGRPEAVLTAGLIHDVYGVRADVTIHSFTGRPHVVFLPQHEEPAPPALC